MDFSSSGDEVAVFDIVAHTFRQQQRQVHSPSQIQVEKVVKSSTDMAGALIPDRHTYCDQDTPTLDINDACLSQSSL